MNEAQRPSEIFQERLKSARELRKWTQTQLAEKAGLPPSSIAHFETGSRKPSFDTLLRVATALVVTVDYLLGRVDEPALPATSDPLYRGVSKLTAHDRELAKDFVDMLAKRNQEKQKE